MSDLKKVLQKPQGILKLVESVFCIVGAVSEIPAHMTWVFDEIVVVSIALGGGALIALALMLSYAEEEDSHLGELIFCIIYAVLNWAGAIIMLIFMLNKTAYRDDGQGRDLGPLVHHYGKNVGSYLLTVCAFGAAICFTIDAVLNLIDTCKK